MTLTTADLKLDRTETNSLGTPVVITATGQKIGLATSLQRGYAGIKANFTAAAEKMPEGDYAFRPVPAVRSFGQQVAHVADDQYNLCAPAKKETNSPPRQASGRKVAAAADLPPAVQARVDRITQSEILGAVVRPLPMALLGIAGRDAFLRTPNGQTGLLKEGEELGGIKLLRIGTNRVLIEHEQQQKELTVFSGFGSETLLPKVTGKATPSESTNKTQSERGPRQTK